LAIKTVTLPLYDTVQPLHVRHVSFARTALPVWTVSPAEAPFPAGIPLSAELPVPAWAAWPAEAPFPAGIPRPAELPAPVWTSLPTGILFSAGLPVPVWAA